VRRRFFVDRFEADSATLRGDTAEHLGRVLRAERGQLYELSDGSRVWVARVESVTLPKRGGSRVEFSLVEQVPAPEPGLHLQLFLSLIKFDRFEWCLEKATELGVSEIVPLAAARTDKQLLSAAEGRMPRWRKIVLASAQQARRLRPPVFTGEHVTIRPARAFEQSAASLKILLSERREAKPIREALREVQVASAALAIGPEGGWRDDETASALTAGFVETSLGENILRTETAVLAALSILRFALSG